MAIQNPRDIIIGPVISEKSYSGVHEKRYSFFVDLRATKSQIKKAVEDIFNVKVLNISTSNIKSKPKRLGRSIGRSSRRKKSCCHSQQEG